MNNRSKTGLYILKVALGIGVLADVLLRQMPWGLNVLLFNLAFVAGTVVLLWRRKPEYLTAQTWALLGAQIFFAAMFVWRDSDELHVADSVAIVVVMSVLFVPQMKIPPRVAGVFHYIVGFIWSTLNAGFAAFALLFSDIEWKSKDRSGRSKNVIAVVRGLLLVTPLILVFGGLFVAADAAYEGLVKRMINFDPSIIFSHAILTAVFAWATAGYLRCILLGTEPKFTFDPPPAADQTGGNATVKERASHSTESKVATLKTDSFETSASLPDNATILEHINRSDPPNASAYTADTTTKSSGNVDPETASKASSKPWSWASMDNSLIPSAFTLGTIEISVVLGLINLLFLSFVIVQIPYLFGGMDLVQNTPDFKLAEYARRGFGELVAVSTLVLPVLLISHWLVRRDNPFAEKLFRALASIQIVLLFVIMASAAQRLFILTGPLGYGMTTVRLYPMIFMSWLGIVFILFALTVLRGYRQYFAWAALWSAFFVLGATHLLNPDEFIVRTNVALMKQGRSFDASYNFNLSADAIPSVISSMPELSFDDQCRVKLYLHNRYRSFGETGDIRSLNWSRKHAWYLLNSNDSLLHEVQGCPSWVQSDLELNKEQPE